MIKIINNFHVIVDQKIVVDILFELSQDGEFTKNLALNSKKIIKLIDNLF